MYRVLWEIIRERDHFNETDLEEIIILEWIFKK